MKKLLLIAALIMYISTTHAVLKNVPGNYATIQLAINASSSGDTILVEPGTYMENINFRGRNVVLTSRYYLTGDPSTINATIINGGNPVYYDTMSCVIINNHEDSTAVLQGFTITGGKGTKWQDEHGAGRYREGGGILIQFSSPVIQFNIIKNNQAISTDSVSQIFGCGGGGIRIGDCYARFYNNVISNNTGRYGAGVVLNYTGCDFRNNIICSNYGSDSYGAGSGLWINSTFTRTKFIINNTIAGNSSINGAPGIYGGSGSVIKNNIVWANSSPSNVQITGAGATVTYCNVQGGYTGSGNLNVVPVFTDSNYILSVSSPCIDKGDSSTVYNDPVDPVNPPAPLYPSRGTIRNDMGAYGGPLTRILTNLLIGIHQIGTGVPNGFNLMQNYPNPFNPSTNIVFSLPQNVFVTLRIYDISGREATTIVNGFKQAGTYNVYFNASDLSSGVYFYKLSAGEFTLTKKMLMIK